MITPRTRNKHGRVGVKRHRPTTNQELRQRNIELERWAGTVVPTARAENLRSILVTIADTTANSKTGVARKVHTMTVDFLASVQ